MPFYLSKFENDLKTVQVGNDIGGQDQLNIASKAMNEILTAGLEQATIEEKGRVVDIYLKVCKEKRLAPTGLKFHALIGEVFKQDNLSAVDEDYLDVLFTALGEKGDAYLSLTDCKLNTGEKFEILSRGLAKTKVNYLSLDRNNINDEEKLKALGTSLKGTKVTWLYLANNNIDTKEKLTALGTSLVDTEVTYLALGGNNIDTKEKLTALGTSLVGTEVTSLSLDNNKINTKEKLTALGTSLVDTEVTSLSLGSNGISTEEQFQALGASLVKTKITTLWLDRNDITEAQYGALVESLNGTMVTRIKGLDLPADLQAQLQANAENEPQNPEAAAASSAPAATMAGAAEDQATAVDEDDDKEQEPASATEAGSNTASSGSEEAVDEATDISAAATAETPTSVQEQQLSQEQLGEMAQEFVRTALDLSSRATVTGGINPQTATVIGNKELGVMTQELVQMAAALHLSRTALSPGSRSQADGAKIITTLKEQAAMIEDLKARVQQVEANFQDSLHKLGLVRTVQGQMLGQITGVDERMVEMHRQFEKRKNSMSAPGREILVKNSGGIIEQEERKIQTLKLRQSFIEIYGQSSGENFKRLEDLIDKVNAKVEKNTKAVDIISCSIKAQKDIDVLEESLLADPNAMEFVTALQTELLSCYNAALFVLDGGKPSKSIFSSPRNLFPWDVQEATALQDIEESAAEMVVTQGVSMASAVLQNIPFIALATKAFQACYDACQARGNNMAAENIFRGIPTVKKMGEIAQRVAVFVAQRHGQALFSLPHEKKLNRWKKLKEFLTGRKAVEGIPARELGKKTAIRMMRSILTKELEDISIDNVEVIMLRDGVQYTQKEQRKYGFEELDEDDLRDYAQLLQNMRGADAEFVDYYTSSASPTPAAMPVGAKITSSQPLAANALLLAASVAPRSPQASGGISPNP